MTSLRHNPGRQSWIVVRTEPSDRQQAERVCAAVLAVLQPVLREVSLDALSDFPDQLPAEVRRAEQALLTRARQTRPDNIRLDLTVDDPAWSDFQTYAAWSIDVDLIAYTGAALGGFHDSAQAVVVDLTDPEAEQLASRLAGTATVLPLRAWRQQRRQEQADRRRQAIRRWWPRRQ